jgi:hypothetical protein
MVMDNSILVTDRYGLAQRSVLVFEGDGLTYIGEGIYIGETTVFAWQTQDGSLVSMNDASGELTEEQMNDIVTNGCKLLVLEGNPVIRVGAQHYYGCQVWWTLKDDTNVQQLQQLQNKLARTERLLRKLSDI